MPSETTVRNAGVLANVRMAAADAFVLAGAAVFLTLAGIFAWAFGNGVVDDAYITLVYARNLANGNGLVWTDGVRVEGYTDFLWVLIGAVAFKADIDPILAYRIVGVTAGVGLLVAVWAWSQRYSVAPPHLRFAPLALGTMGPVAYWAVAGLEATAVAALAFAGTLAATLGGRAVIASGALFFLAALAHPDAVVLLAPVGLYLLAKSWKGRHWSDVARLTLAFGIPFGIYWLSRWLYFGDPLPNTFYAKSTFSSQHLTDAYLYLMRFAPIGSLLAAYLILRGFMKGLLTRPETNLLGGQLVLWIAYLFYVGGDFMEMWRFLVPILPAVALLLQEACWTVASRARLRRTGFAVSGVIVVAVSLMWAGGWTGWFVNPSGFANRLEVREGWRDMGRWLNAHSAPDDVVAVTAAGAIPYFSERPAIDMLGLTDKHIARHGHIDHTKTTAHKRHDAAYVLDRAPEFIVMNNIREIGLALTDDNAYGVDRGERLEKLPTNESLLADDRFWSNYTRVRILALEGHHVLMVRNDVLKRPELSGVVEVVPLARKRVSCVRGCEAIWDN